MNDQPNDKLDIAERRTDWKLARLKDCGFYPFEDAPETSADPGVLNDFPAELFKERLGLTVSQWYLLMEMLSHIEIRTWYGAGHDGDKCKPTLELLVFWKGNHVKSVDLLEMLDVSLAEDLAHLEYDEELFVLHKLQDIISKAIESTKAALAASPISVPAG